eukprot:5919251-Prymnesium_polylepis.3
MTELQNVRFEPAGLQATQPPKYRGFNRGRFETVGMSVSMEVAKPFGSTRGARASSLWQELRRGETGRRNGFTIRRAVSSTSRVYGRLSFVMHAASAAQRILSYFLRFSSRNRRSLEARA